MEGGWFGELHTLCCVGHPLSGKREGKKGLKEKKLKLLWVWKEPLQWQMLSLRGRQIK